MTSSCRSPWTSRQTDLSVIYCPFLLLRGKLRFPRKACLSLRIWKAQPGSVQQSGSTWRLSRGTFLHVFSSPSKTTFPNLELGEHEKRLSAKIHGEQINAKIIDEKHELQYVKCPSFTSVLQELSWRNTRRFHVKVKRFPQNNLTQSTEILSSLFICKYVAVS